MRIKVLRNLGAGWPPWHEGEVVETDEAQARRLIDLGLAEPVPETLRTVVHESELRAVPPEEPESAESSEHPKRRGHGRR
jgi:hypothetical protein